MMEKEKTTDVNKYQICKKKLAQIMDVFEVKMMQIIVGNLGKDNHISRESKNEINKLHRNLEVFMNTIILSKKRKSSSVATGKSNSVKIQKIDNTKNSNILGIKIGNDQGKLDRAKKMKEENERKIIDKPINPQNATNPFLPPPMFGEGPHVDIPHYGFPYNTLTPGMMYHQNPYSYPLKFSQYRSATMSPFTQLSDVSKSNSKVSHSNSHVSSNEMEVFDKVRRKKNERKREREKWRKAKSINEESGSITTERNINETKSASQINYSFPSNFPINKINPELITESFSSVMRRPSGTPLSPVLSSTPLVEMNSKPFSKKNK